MHTHWPALAAARWQSQERTAFHIDGAAVGSVACTHRQALQRWPKWVFTDSRGLHLIAPAAARNDALAEMNARLRQEGLIVAWRDEAFPLYEPASGAVLAIFERAACRFWGTLTRGAHCNGFVADAGGQPADLWIARRALTKATDPGKRDNLIGGGVPHGQTPHETLVREGWEEAGLTQAQMAAAQAGRIIRIDCDVPEGRMVEDIHVFDLALPAHVVPQNQDGEVSDITRLSAAQAAACAAAGEMTTDAALVTLDFLLRHQLLPPGTAPELAESMRRLYKD
jgi:8-oxo-dGTP pyrophosphatase MutT (NUDIX family)